LGCGVLHGIPVRIAAHHDADQGLRHLVSGIGLRFRGWE
jgi:hypothetical protein